MSLETWTLEKIKEGFEKFFQDYGRYPTADEVDKYNSLPSARQIQRRFHGLINLRNKLGLPIENYGKGVERSKIAVMVNKKGKDCEKIVFDFLKSRFDERFIHIEKPINYNHRSRCDFYVYAKPENFIIDVFNARDARMLVKIMNIKEKAYERLMTNEILYFVYFGEIEIKKLEQWLINRKNKPLSPRWKIVDFDKFKLECKNYISYEVI